MKQYYDYSPELPETSTTGNLNLESPLLRPVIAWIRKIARDAVKKENLPNFTIGNIDCYRVEPDSSEKLPAILYCHGGGFFLPLQPAMVRIGRYYQEQLNVRVFFPEYRIAPEDPFPTPFDDCYRSYCYLIEHAELFFITPICKMTISQLKSVSMPFGSPPKFVNCSQCHFLYCGCPSDTFRI